MTNICITGAAGLLGQHAQIHLTTIPDVMVRPIDHATFDDVTALRSALADADVVYHFAGQNRGEPDAVAAANVAIADRLASALAESRSTAHLIYSNSIHSTGKTPYGISKKTVADRLADWAAKSDGRFTDVLLPHVFGEHGKPFYNSVVSTWLPGKRRRSPAMVIWNCCTPDKLLNCFGTASKPAAPELAAERSGPKACR
jgi:UDP-2-acetamido-2,6-beta-L-arabino-hexul-4-ose reductase